MKTPQFGILGRRPANRNLIHVVTVLLVCVATPASTQKPRARDLGVPFEGTPGRLNAITDVDGVEVGHATIVRGSGLTQLRLQVFGQHPVEQRGQPRGQHLVYPLDHGGQLLPGTVDLP